VEAVVLSSFGGLIGIVLALAGSLWLSAALHKPFVLNGRIVLIAEKQGHLGGNEPAVNSGLIRRNKCGDCSCFLR
jgi:hypothetical protein